MSYKLIAERTVKAARKMHKCIWCGEAIHKGDSYTYERSIFEGEPQSHHWHPECLAQMRAEAGDEPAHELAFDAHHQERPVPQHGAAPK